MNLPDIFNNETYINQILEANIKAQKYGLILTEEDVFEIIKERENALKNHGRIEIDIKVTEKIIDFLCSSPYINEDNFSYTIIEFQEIFYYLKTETDDKIADDRLLNSIFKLYENPCAGSLELLKGRESDKLIKRIKYQNPDNIYSRGDSDEF